MSKVRILSYNVNGIRAAMKKGWLEWLANNPADIICVQETKAHKDDVDYRSLEALGFHHYWFSAQKKGYSGVAIFSKIKADAIYTGTGYAQSDSEGRVIRADFGDLTLVNAYFPSGTSGDERQTYKYQWLSEIDAWLTVLAQERPNLVLCGDYNIAHTEIDIHDPKGNKKSSGFLPEERQWMDRFLAAGWIDSFRVFHPEGQRYSWWSQRFPSVRLQNKGWRIDYICVSAPLKDRLLDAEIWPDIKHSDHCPVYVVVST